MSSLLPRPYHVTLPMTAPGQCGASGGSQVKPSQASTAVSVLPLALLSEPTSKPAPPPPGNWPLSQECQV